MRITWQSFFKSFFFWHRTFLWSSHFLQMTLFFCRSRQEQSNAFNKVVASKCAFSFIYFKFSITFPIKIVRWFTFFSLAARSWAKNPPDPPSSSESAMTSLVSHSCTLRTPVNVWSCDSFLSQHNTLSHWMRCFFRAARVDGSAWWKAWLRAD